MIFRHLIYSFGFCLMLSFSTFSCTTDPRETDPNNFVQAINDGLKNSKCVSAQLTTEEEMRLFESAGLIDIHMEIFLEREDIFINPLSDDEPELVKVKRLSYDVNAAGKKYYEAQPPFHKSFCYGNIQVIDIVNFTEPADTGGLTVSRVTYTK